MNIQYKMKKSDQLNMIFQDVSFFLSGLDARIQGLHDIVTHHSTIVNVHSFQRINSNMYDESVVKLALQLSVNDVDKANALLRSNLLDPKKDFVYLRPSKCIVPHFHVESLFDVVKTSVSSPEMRVEESKTLASPLNHFMFTRSNRGEEEEKAGTIPSLASINIDEMDDKALIDMDMGSLLSNTTFDFKIDDIPADVGEDISLEELTNVDLSSVCTVCMQDKPSEVNQLIECTHCSKKYHTTCVNLPQIPYSTLVPVEKRKREIYMEEHYKHWLCPACKDVKPTLTSPTSAPSSPPCSPRHRGRSFSSPRFASPIPLQPEVHTLLDSSEPDSSLVNANMPRSFFQEPLSNIVKAAGTDLSQGGVVVGTKDYATLQKTLQFTYKQLAQPIPPQPPTVAHLDADLVPILSQAWGWE